MPKLWRHCLWLLNGCRLWLLLLWLQLHRWRWQLLWLWLWDLRRLWLLSWHTWHPWERIDDVTQALSVQVRLCKTSPRWEVGIASRESGQSPEGAPISHVCHEKRKW